MWERSILIDFCIFFVLGCSSSNHLCYKRQESGKSRGRVNESVVLMRSLLFSPERQISLVLAKGNFTKKKKKTKRSYDEQVKLQCRVSNT